MSAETHQCLTPPIVCISHTRTISSSMICLYWDICIHSWGVLYQFNHAEIIKWIPTSHSDVSLEILAISRDLPLSFNLEAASEEGLASSSMSTLISIINGHLRPAGQSTCRNYCYSGYFVGYRAGLGQHQVWQLLPWFSLLQPLHLCAITIASN